MSNHDHIINRFYPHLQESKSESAQHIENALKEIRENARNLPLQQQLDIMSALMDIEAALNPAKD